MADHHGSEKKWFDNLWTDRPACSVKELLESKAKLETALDSMSDAVFISDRDGRFVDFNEAFATFHRFKSKADCGKTLADYPRILDVYSMTGELLPIGQWAVPRALRGETGSGVEFILQRKDTGETWIGSYNYAPLVDDAGIIFGSVVTARDVTENKRIEENLKIAKREAERADMAKSHFLAAASHDLRQPFQALRIFIDILNEQTTDSGTLRVARAADEALKIGENLLNALLDISKFDAGGISPKRDFFRLSDLMVTLAGSFEEAARRKGLRLTVVPCRAYVYSDPVLLSRLLQNILANAVKYTERGRILFGCRPLRDAVRIEVWDTGIGMTPEQMELIFEDFFQIGNDARDQAKGLGLGLSIVRRTALLLGHAIDVRSWPGRGSVFSATVSRLAIPIA